MSIFDDIYAHNHWGFGSGHGSLPNVTKGYRAYVEQFIRNNGVQRVFEYGCGDWQFSHLIDWGSAEYTGVDIVPAVIEANTKRYGSEKVRFSVNTLTDTNLPHADLLITKDVLQHLATDDIKRFIQHIMPKYRFCLITNCILPTEDINQPIKTGEFRPLDLRQPPFSVPGAVVYSFTGPRSYSRSERKFFPAWIKQTLLVYNAKNHG